MVKRPAQTSTRLVDLPALQVSLKKVRLLSSSTSQKMDEDSPPKHLWFRAETAVAELRQSGKSCIVPVKLDAFQHWASSKGKDPKSKVDTECSYEVIFVASRCPTDDETKSIIEMAVRCGWPYARAFMQYAISQMGLPPIPLPLVQIKDGKEMEFVSPAE